MKSFKTIPNHSHKVRFPWEVINSQYLLTNLDSIVNQALQNTYQYLRQFRFDAGYTQKLETAFGNDFNRSVANQLFDKLAQGNFSDIPSIEIVNRNDINGANGAFAIATGKIYLSQEFITANAHNLNAIVSVLLEEYGHYVDSRINTKDAAGDEGDIFARLVQGDSLSQQELVVLKAEDDSATVMLDGQVIQIEQDQYWNGASSDWWDWGVTRFHSGGTYYYEDDKGDGAGIITAGTSGSNKYPVYGYGGNDSITGGETTDYISGGDGNDRIEARGGDDRIDGDNGNDLIIGGNGNDEINGGNDWDIVDYQGNHYFLPSGNEKFDKLKREKGVSNIPIVKFTGALTGYSYSYKRISKNGLGFDTLNDIEEIRGTNQNDTLYTDPVIGLKRLEGNEGNDKLFAISSLKSDSLLGRLGPTYYATNQLFGEDGDDVLYADVTKDGKEQYLTGGAGKDKFVIGAPKEGETQETAQQAVDFVIGAFSGINPVATVISAGLTWIKDLFWTKEISGVTSDVVIITDFKIGEDVIILPNIDRSKGEDYSFKNIGGGSVRVTATLDNIKEPVHIIRIDTGSTESADLLVKKLDDDWVGRENSNHQISYISSQNLLVSDPQEANSGKKIVGGYFPEWGIYGRDFQVEDIPADKLTHLFYAFAQIDQNGKVAIYDPWAATDTTFNGKYTYEQSQAHQAGNFAELKKLKAVNPNLNLMLSIGGWSLTGPFSTVASTDASRTTFAQSAVDFMVKYGFDGIDIDWEYPVGGGADINEVERLAPKRLNKEVKNSPDDKRNYTLLLAELDEQIEIQEANKGRDYQLSIAAPAGFKNIQNLELGEISKHIDFFNLMAYDFHGSTFEPNTTNHQAALFTNPNDPSEAEIADKFNIHSAVQAYLAAGVDPQDIVLGAPLYGRAWSGVSNNTNGGLFKSATGVAPGTWEDGVLDYDDLYNRLTTQPQNYTRYWDNEAKVPYIYSPTANGGFFSTYEDSQSIGLKTNYIKNMDLGGMFFWDISSDLPSNNSNSLINNAHKYLTLGERFVDTSSVTNPGQGTDTIQSSVTFTIANLPNIGNVTLTGTAAINGTGNTANNVITGNTSNNTLNGDAGNDLLNGGAGNDLLTGGTGKDSLTGGVGVDRFDYRNLADSVFNSFDVITDFNANAGNDLFLVSTARSKFSNAGSVATLDATGIAAKLTTTNFTANSAAQFTFGNRTFVAINDATAGFNTNKDAIIEVTGLTGTLGLNNFTTTNDDVVVSPSITLAVSPSSVLENGTTNLLYTFTRTGATTNALTVNYGVAGTATFNNDYTQIGAANFTATTGTITFAAGSSTKTLTIDPTADTTVESNETVALTLASGTGYTVGTTTAVTGTITNDDVVVSPSISLAVSPSSVLENGITNLFYTFTRTGATTNALTVNYGVAGTATFNNDYTQIGAANFTATTGTITFAAGSSTKTLTIDPTADTTVESNETVALTLASGTGYTVGTTTAVTGTITNDDVVVSPSISLAVSPSSVLENGITNLLYTFTRTGATTNALTVNYGVAGTATFNNDYTQIGAANFTATTGTITFAAGSSTKTLTIDPTADTTVESNETVALKLAAGTGYTIGTTTAVTGTITNDDTANVPLTLTGNATNNNLVGGSGNDTLLGLGGQDTLTGGLGADKFRFNSPFDGMDTITDFSRTQGDKIQLFGTGFNSLVWTDGVSNALAPSVFSMGTSANSWTNSIIYNNSNGIVYFDADALGSGSQIALAQLSPGLNLTNQDFIVSW